MIKTTERKPLMTIAMLVLAALARDPNRANAQGSQGRPSDIIITDKRQFDTKPNPLKEGLRENIERLARANAIFDSVHADLVQHNDGSPKSTLKINLVALKMTDTRADLILPTITMLDEYRIKILADTRQNDLLEKRSRLEVDRSLRAIEKLAEEVVEARAKLAGLPKDSREVRDLEEAIDDKTDEIKNLVNKRDQNVAQAESFAEANQADREELESLRTLYRQLSQMTRRERYYAERLGSSIEESEAQMVREERRAIRESLEMSLNLLNGRDRPPDVVGPLRPRGNNIPIKTNADPRPPVDPGRDSLADERVREILKKAEEKRTGRTTPVVDRAGR